MSIQYNPLSDTPHDLVVLADGNVVSYEAFVCNLVKDRESLDGNMEHMVRKLASEAGELIDAIAKKTIYNKELNRENVIEELGDIEWYAAGLRQMLGITRRDVLDYNVLKLGKRYKSDSYSDQQAQARADKQVVGTDGQPLPGAGLHVLDMSAKVSDEQVKAVDETAQVQSDGVTDARSLMPAWTYELLDEFHPGKKVVAFNMSRHTATVLFEGDTNPYKLYLRKEQRDAAE